MSLNGVLCRHPTLQAAPNIDDPRPSSRRRTLEMLKKKCFMTNFELKESQKMSQFAMEIGYKAIEILSGAGDCDLFSIMNQIEANNYEYTIVLQEQMRFTDETMKYIGDEVPLDLFACVLKNYNYIVTKEGEAIDYKYANDFQIHMRISNAKMEYRAWICSTAADIGNDETKKMHERRAGED
eukprot:15367843-Heterocapsa_arctica.AAC.1